MKICIRNWIKVNFKINYKYLSLDCTKCICIDIILKINR